MNESTNEHRSDRWLTIPNVLCLIRLIGSLIIIPVAISERPHLVLIIFLLLALTDWVDGKVARWFDQRSRIGPKLDSLADVSMYAMLLFAAVWLRTDVFLQELPWLSAAAALFAIACITSLIKFGSLPSYHTRSAKTSWLLTVIAAISLFLAWSPWPVRIAAISVFIANLESIAITRILSQPQSDVISFRAARRLERQSSSSKTST